MRNPWRDGRRRLATFGLAAALVLVPAAAASAASPTSTASVSGSDRAAAVQAVLDRVLGPGNAVVTVSDTIQTSTASTTNVQWGTGVTGSSAVQVVQVGGATTAKSVAAQNLVGGTTTSTVTPAGSLVRQTVSVAIDRAHLGGRSVSALRSLVASSAGIVTSRGDSLTLVVTPFAKPAAITVAPAPSILTVLAPYAVPAIWVLGGVLAVVVLALAFGGRPKTGRQLARR